MKTTIVTIGPGYQFHAECDICKGREGRRYDATFTFDCGGVLKGVACSPCWKKHTAGQVVDLQKVTEHVHLNDDKRVWESLDQARQLFAARVIAARAKLIGEPGGTEYELVWPEDRARVYRHYGDAPCPWKPAPLPEPVTGQLLTALAGLYAMRSEVLNQRNAAGEHYATGPGQDHLAAAFEKAREAIARAERR